MGMGWDGIYWDVIFREYHIQWDNIPLNLYHASNGVGFED